MPLAPEVKEELIKRFGKNEGDTGSTEVQVALLTQRIRELTIHLKEHKHDYASTRGLKKLVGQRKRLLRYLAKQDVVRYRDICVTLEIRT